jgi:UDP-N-acetylglucosamine 2-epimerase (non-hydrolysing)
MSGERDRPLVMCVVGARPNFVKIAPILRAMVADGSLEPLLVHTGQHYDPMMSEIFFRDLGISVEPFNLRIGSGTHATQLAAVLRELEPVVADRAPDIILTVGDVNSTLAAALVAAHSGVPLAHVEAGLRSGDPHMPEEVNRVVTDRLSDLLFTHSDEADENLLREGVDRQRIHHVGNVMIDSLQFCRPHWTGAASGALGERLPKRYGVVTLHRPANVDDPNRLQLFLSALCEAARELPLIFPVHPRTAPSIHRVSGNGLRVVKPMGYLAFLDLMERASVVITDSGGVQEETTALGVPCLTLRASTERPVTIRLGTNRLVGDEPAAIPSAVRTALKDRRAVQPIPTWDGHAASRIVDVLVSELEKPMPPRLAA